MSFSDTSRDDHQSTWKKHQQGAYQNPEERALDCIGKHCGDWFCPVHEFDSNGDWGERDEIGTVDGRVQEIEQQWHCNWD